MVKFTSYLVAFKSTIGNILKKPYTVLFPSESVPTPEGFRGEPVLTPEDCTLCKRCLRVCPAQALNIEKIDGEDYDFTIDLGRCTYCQECEDSCKFGAIVLSDNWLTAKFGKNELITHYTVNKPEKKSKSKVKEREQEEEITIEEETK